MAKRVPALLHHVQLRLPLEIRRRLSSSFLLALSLVVRSLWSHVLNVTPRRYVSRLVPEKLPLLSHVTCCASRPRTDRLP
eukprot:scaffold1809_cov228-Pinguiococcus_pyrenoidosus.AAC.24